LLFKNKSIKTVSSSKSEVNSLNHCNKSKYVDENKVSQIYDYLYHSDNQFPDLIYGFPKNTCLPPQSHEIYIYSAQSTNNIIVNPQALNKSLRLAAPTPPQPQLATTPSSASSQASLNCLKCLSTNATSLNNIKLLELSMIVTDQNIDLIFITETWFSELSTTNLPHYNVHRKDRADRHGGVAIYTKDQLNVISAQSFASHNSEQMWLNVIQGNETILIGCIYRPPTSDAPAFLEIANNLKKAKCLLDEKKITGILLTGDFNLPNINWTETYVNDSSSNSFSARFYDIIQSLHLIQHVDFPTFNKADGTALNTLDLIITGSQHCIPNVNSTHPLGHARQGHLVLYWNYVISSEKSPIHPHSTTLNYKKGDYKNLSNYISSHDWPSIIIGQNIEDSYEAFRKIYDHSTATFIPKKGKKQKKYKNPWTTVELIKLSKTKNKLFNQLRASNGKFPLLEQQYKRARSDTKKLIKKCISDYELSLALDKCNPKKLFTYVNSKVKTSNIITSINCNNTTTTNATEIANILNKQFHSVFTNNSPDSPPVTFHSRTTASISTASITNHSVLHYLSKLAPDKSTGSDGISPYVLHTAREAFAPVLALLFNESLELGTIPALWSEANVTPIYKSKGSRLDPSNYRPISITSVPCKIMEKLIRNSITLHLKSNDLISPRQHGFVSNKACNTNLLESNDLLTKLASTKTPADIVFLDFAKAFDKVSHPLLILKLKKYGLDGNLIKWITAFLTNRRQRVVSGNTVSDWLPVLSGVPQGSVLGPTLFIIFINDLTDKICNHASLYADDTKLICGLDPLQTAKISASLQNDINGIVDWTKTWHMELNISKCKVMHVGKKNPEITYTMNNYSDNQPTPLLTTITERDLGITISSDLKLYKQCVKAASTAYKIFGMLKKAFVSRTLFIWKTLYTTYIRPHLEFAIAAWNHYQKKDINILERVQRRVTKIITSINHLKYPERCKSSGLTTLVRRHD